MEPNMAVSRNWVIVSVNSIRFECINNWIKHVTWWQGLMGTMGKPCARDFSVYWTKVFQNHNRVIHLVRYQVDQVQLNKVKCQLDETRWFYWCILSSTCFGYIRPSSGALDVELQDMVFCTEFLDEWWSWEPLRRSCVRCGWWTVPSAPYTRPTQRLSRPPPIQKLGAENHTLQLNIQCSWWWAYAPETCRAKNTSIKLPSYIKLAFHSISWGKCTVKQPLSSVNFD